MIFDLFMIFAPIAIILLGLQARSFKLTISKIDNYVTEIVDAEGTKVHLPVYTRSTTNKLINDVNSSLDELLVTIQNFNKGRQI